MQRDEKLKCLENGRGFGVEEEKGNTWPFVFLSLCCSTFLLLLKLLPTSLYLAQPQGILHSPVHSFFLFAIPPFLFPFVPFPSPLLYPNSYPSLPPYHFPDRRSPTHSSTASIPPFTALLFRPTLPIPFPHAFTPPDPTPSLQ